MTDKTAPAHDFSVFDGVDHRIDNGGWIGGLPNLPATMRIKVRSIANPDFQRIRADVDKTLEAGAPRPDDKDAYLLRKGILLDWDGFPMPFSDEAAAEGLKRRSFRNACWYAATMVAAEGKDSLEDLKGNS